MSDPRAAAVVAGYAPVASAYVAELSDELAGKPLDRALLTLVAEQAQGPIVDIGCGPGHVAAFLAARGASVSGIDLSPEMIAAARTRHPSLRFEAADMFALPFADGSLGGAVLMYAIVHLKTSELAAPFRELRRVLAPNGLALVAFHAGDETKHVDELFGCATSLDFIFHEPEAVIAALAQAGLPLEMRIDRKPYPDVEYPSERTYLLVRA
jgi:SAM-dependent methyltransferase